MMSRIAILLLAAVAAVTGENIVCQCVDHDTMEEVASRYMRKTEHELVAVVNLTPHDVGTRNVSGELTITQSVHNGPVVIRGTVYGLTEGLHGFHVHEKGDMSNRCLSTGAHFNPENVTHGAPEDTVRHVGDLGNIEANMNGVAIVDITDNLISLTGPNNILGRAIVVHSAEDDLGKGNSTLSTTTGNAGDRWACGIVAALSPTGRWENAGSFIGPNVSMLVTAFTILVYQHIKN